MPVPNPSHGKSSAQITPGGDKPQKPKISWNAWANTDGLDHPKRPTEKKEPEPRRDVHVMDGPPQRGSQDPRRSRDDSRWMAGKFPRKEDSRPRLEPRRGRRDSDREKSPNRHFKNPKSRSSEGSFRRGPPAATQAGMPPGMHYGKGPQTMRSGPVESSRPASHQAAFRAMPPGLGVSGPPPPRVAPRGTDHGPPGDSYRGGMPVRDDPNVRDRSPARYDKAPRVTSPQRYGRPRRPHSPPRLQEPLQNPAPVNRSRSPPHNALPPTHLERNNGQRPPQRRRHHMDVDEEDETSATVRQRPDNPSSFRPRATVPASPRRFIVPVRNTFLHGS